MERDFKDLLAQIAKTYEVIVKPNEDVDLTLVNLIEDIVDKKSRQLSGI